MTKRRDFIKISALGIGGLASAKAGLGLWANTVTTSRNTDEFLSATPTYCEVCFWKCAGWIQKDNQGNIKNIIGHRDDPHCNGRLCPRGTGGIGMYYDKDRLTTPLIRVEADGQQTFREATWEEALQLVADQMKKIASQYGPESMALFNHGSSGSHFGHLLKAFGSSNIVAPSYAQCRGPREVAWKATFGETLGSPEPLDIRDTRCLVLIGSHLGENMHNGQVQEMAEAIDRGADIITVDPRFSTVASKSKHWLPIKPATDLALLLSWIHVLIYENLFDEQFVEKNCHGFEQLKHHVRRMTPEWCYGITTIKPAEIRRTARLMAGAAPAAIVHPGRHVTWYGDDTQRSRAIAIINALLGNWGQRGGFYFAEKVSLPSFPHPPYPEPDWSWRDLHEGKYPLAGLAISNAFIDASIAAEKKKHQLKGWIVSGTNLPLTIPNKPRFEQAVQDLDFIAVVDTMPMEITGYADVILPECTYLERYDTLRTAPHRKPYLALRQPAGAPLGDSKPAWWMAKHIGAKLGLDAYFNYHDYSEVIDWQLKQIGSSLQELEKTGIKEFPRKSGSLFHSNSAPLHFNTPTGKIELFATEFEELGFDPLPNYRSHPEPQNRYYRLIYGRAPMHTFSRTANNPYLADLMAENNCWINPKVAKIWSLENGQKIWLKNQDGVVSTFPIQVRITERIRYDSIYMVHGFGHHEKQLTQAFGKGTDDTELITDVKIDPIMGGTGMRGNFVTFLLEPESREI